MKKIETGWFESSTYSLISDAGKTPLSFPVQSVIRPVFIFAFFLQVVAGRIRRKINVTESLSINQSIDRMISRSNNWENQSINPSTNQSITHTINQSIDQSMKGSMKGSIKHIRCTCRTSTVKNLPQNLEALHILVSERVVVLYVLIAQIYHLKHKDRTKKHEAKNATRLHAYSKTPMAGQMDRHEDQVVREEVHTPSPPFEALVALIHHLRVEKRVERVDFGVFSGMAHASIDYHLQEKVRNLQCKDKTNPIKNYQYNQSINPSNNQSINQLIASSIKRNWSIKSSNQSTDHPNQLDWTNQSINQTNKFDQSNWVINQSVRSWVFWKWHLSKAEPLPRH